MRDGELLMSKDKESNIKLKDDIKFMENRGKDEQELLLLQQTWGNQHVVMLLDSQEDDELIKSLSVPMKEKIANKGKAMKQLQPGQSAPQEEYPEKLGELVLPTGLIHVGCDRKNNQVVLVTEENREDQKKEPLHNNQKMVIKNKPGEKDENSQVLLSQNWKNGAVAIIDNLEKKPKKIIQNTKKIVAKEEESGNLKQVLPFLDQDREKKELQQLKKQLDLTNEQQKAAKADKKTAKVKEGVNRSIAKKNIIADKKKSAEMELSNKIEHSLKNIKSASVQAPVKEDYFELLFAKRRKKPEEEKEKNKDQVKGAEEL